jgi:hypothetical protein
VTLTSFVSTVPTVHPERATKVHVQGILSTQPLASAALRTATNSALEYGAIAATLTANVVQARHSAATECVSPAIARFPEAHRGLQLGEGTRPMELVAHQTTTLAIRSGAIAAMRTATAAQMYRTVAKDGEFSIRSKHGIH